MKFSLLIGSVLMSWGKRRKGMHALIVRLQVTARLLRSRQVDAQLPISVIISRGRLRMVTLGGSVVIGFEG